MNIPVNIISVDFSDKLRNATEPHQINERRGVTYSDVEHVKRQVAEATAFYKSAHLEFTKLYRERLERIFQNLDGNAWCQGFGGMYGEFAEAIEEASKGLMKGADIVADNNQEAWLQS
jgi:hypothetical protein